MLALIRLQDGTEVIGSVKEDHNSKIVLEDPLQINYRLVAHQPMPTVSISRYMPFAEEQIFSFDKEDVMHIVQPKKSMAEYYKSALKNYKMVIDGNIDEELASAAHNDEEEVEGDINDAYKALLERMNFKGPLN
jgi:bifunctional ADP-heptose synthase (sugar kinase/adenylyltransferase)